MKFPHSFVVGAALLAALLVASPVAAQFVPPLFTTQWGGYGTSTGRFSEPYGIAESAAGEVFVVDGFNQRIQVFDRHGTFLRQWGSAGAGNGQFQFPRGIAVSGSEVFVTDQANYRVQVFSTSGTFLRKWGTPGSGNGQFSAPWGIDVDTDGSVYVLDLSSGLVQVFTSAGAFLRKWIVSAGTCDWLALDHAGHVWVTDFQYDRVREWTTTGSLVRVIGDPGGGSGLFNTPSGVAVDHSGFVYVADPGNHLVQVLSPTGSFIGQWGASILTGDPMGIAVDADGYVFVTDVTGNLVYEFLEQAPVPTRAATWGGLKARYR